MEAQAPEEEAVGQGVGVVDAGGDVVAMEVVQALRIAVSG